jgi:cysteinyl-tRNA synthetase
MTTPDPGLTRLVEEREAARAARDFARADALRAELRALGWLVTDTAAGSVLEPAKAHRTYKLVEPARLAPRWEEQDRLGVSVVVHVTGWADDVARALAGLAAHAGAIDYEVVVVDDGAGPEVADALERLAAADARVRVLHLAAPIGFGAAMNLAMGQATGRVLVWLDPHVEPTGDVLGQLLAALDRPGVGLAGGWGVVTTTLTEFEADDGPEVDAIEGYLLAVPRRLAARVRVDPADRYYRNADLDYSFAVRDLGVRAIRVDVGARRHVHRGWHEADPAERERASKRNYRRFLARWHHRQDLLTRQA